MSQPPSPSPSGAALHPALLAQLRALGLSAEHPTPEGWALLLQHVSAAYEAREQAPKPPAINGGTLTDEDLSLFDASLDAIIIFDPHNERIVVANERAADLYAYSAEELVGLSVRKLSANPQNGRSHIDAVLQMAENSTDGWFHFETTQRRRDGAPVSVAIQARPIRFQGAPAVLSINRDVTELKRTQRALALSQERFAHIFNASPVAAAVIDLSGHILHANQAILALFEVADAVEGKRIYDLDIRSGSGGEPLSGLPLPPLRDHDLRLSGRAGGDRTVLMSSEWLDLGDERHILVQMVDITERKQTEAELRTSENRALTLLSAVKRQAREAALLHEVRTLIAGENDLPAIVRAVVQGIREHFGYELVSVYFQEQDRLVLQNQVGYPHVLDYLSLTQGVMARTLRTGEPELVEDVTRDPDFLSELSGVRSEVSVPLFVGAAPVGVLNVETIDEVLTTHDLSLCIALGAHISLAVQRARLYSELQNSNDRYDALLRSMQEVVYQVDGEGNWTYLNPAWERQSGFRVADALGRSWTERLHPDDQLPLVLRFLRLIRQHASAYSMRARFVTADGHDRWCEHTGKLYYSDAGEYIGTSGTATDVTERVHAEQRERQQRQLAEALVENAAALAVAESTEAAIQGAMRHIQRVIPGFAALRVALIELGMAHMVTFPVPGVPDEVVTDMSVWEMEEHHLPLYDADSDRAGARSFSHLPPGALTLPGLDWVRAVLVAPLRSRESLLGYLYLDSLDPAAFGGDEAQWVQGFADQLGTALFNLRLRAEMTRHAQELELRVADRTEQFRQAKEQVEAILNTSSDPIVLMNASGTILHANTAFDQALRMPAEMRAARPSIDAFFDASSVPLLTEVLHTAMDGAREQRKLNARRADGTTFPADVAIDPLRDADGAARGAVLSLHDISEYRMLEDTLRAALDEERQLVELKSRFGMMVSHEFRTPLASIQTSADLLQTYHERLTTERRVEALNTITRQVGHLSAMLDDILAISKADTVGMDYQPAPTDLAELGQSLVEEMRWLDNDRHLLDFTMDENVTPRLILDRGLLRRALMNLLINALKYSPQNTVVEFSVKQRDHRIIMTIRDEGIGVPEDELPRLFDSFFRASNVGDVPGTGLGLAIARRAIEAHGGEIQAFSEQGQGSTFQLSFPARAP
jgi:PAS domain S-box-containing protein